MTKAKKKNLSESVQQKNKKQLNPFEVHINKDKQKVLGRKSKNDHGLPGVSKAKAINRRKQSLLQEYKLQNKDNVFLDKRIGENCAMSTEDKVMARFAKERMKAYKKESIFNLNDEILTHRGQTLEEIEKFDDPRSDDELSDNENVNGKLDKNFVETHFGGGTLSKTDSTLSRKDLIDQLIAESKKRKAEKQKIREQTIDLTEKLDSEWRHLLPFISTSKESMEDINETKTDTYDITVRQLKFEARGNPSEKLKSEEEIIEEGKEKLEKLETDRLIRMKGLICDSNQYKHKSADDLEDGFIMETIIENDDIIDDSIAIDINNKENSDTDDNEREGNNVNKEIVKNVKMKKYNKNQERMYSESFNAKDKSDTDLNDKDSEIENLDNEESEDDFSDLKMSESFSEDESEIQVITASKKHVLFSNDLTKDTKQINQSDKICLEPIQSSSTYTQDLSDKKQQFRNDLLKQKKIMEKAQNELSYIYNAPENFEELEKLLKHYSAEYQSVIVDRIIKYNHWTLDGRNRDKMSNLFIYLLQYVNNCASTENVDDLIKCFQIFDRYK